jgi:hypothetical protein
MQVDIENSSANGADRDTRTRQRREVPGHEMDSQRGASHRHKWGDATAIVQLMLGKSENGTADGKPAVTVSPDPRSREDRRLAVATAGRVIVPEKCGAKRNHQQNTGFNGPDRANAGVPKLVPANAADRTAGVGARCGPDHGSAVGTESDDATKSRSVQCDKPASNKALHHLNMSPNLSINSPL